MSAVKGFNADVTFSNDVMRGEKSMFCAHSTVSAVMFSIVSSISLIIQSDMCHAIFPPLGLIAVVQKLFRTFLIFLMIYSTQLKT